MRLSTLTVENFKQFERAHIAFAPGFTVLKGPNEAGKSTIQTAILAALFLDPHADEQEMAEYIQWGQEERFHLRLEFEHDGARYLLSKDFRAGTLSLQWSQPDGTAGGSTADPVKAQRMIADLLGTRSMEAYLNTACIRSEDISKEPAAGAPVSQRLQAKVTGGRRAAAADVIRALERELEALAGDGPRHLSETGALRMARERIEALERARDAAAVKLAAYQEHTRRVARLREEYRGLEAAIAARTEQLELSDRVEIIEEECALLSEHRQELQQAEILRASIGQAADYVSGMDQSTIVSAIERTQALERQINQQKLREAELGRQLAETMLSHLQQTATIPRTLVLLGGIALAIACVAIAAFSHLLAILAGVVPALALIVLALSASPLNPSPLRQELRRCTEQVRAAERDLARLLSQFGLHSVEELALVGRTLRPAGELRATHEQRIADLLGARHTENWQPAIAQVTQEIELRRAELAALGDRRLDPEDYERIDQELEQLRPQRDQMQRELYRLEGELRANDVDSEVLAALDEELAAEQAHKARLQRRRTVLQRALSGMREARAITLLETSAVFRGGVAKHLAAITDGRYDQVDAHVDEQGLHLIVWAADKRRAVKADSLSRATQDQIYLAARLALMELVCDGAQPPLLLDDPFVNYDETRLENTMRLLRRLYAPYQILLFTCTDRYDGYADQVITLGDLPSIRDPDPATSVAAS